MSLHRPLDMADLEAAFMEVENACEKYGERAKQALSDYKDGKEIDRYWKDIFKSVPSHKYLDDYVNKLIEGHNDTFNRRGSYHINVELKYISDDFLSFHKSLNPRVTFGYSNFLREECDFELSKELKELFIFCFRGKENDMNANRKSYGGFEFGNYNLRYEDLFVYCGDREMLGTTTHEDMMDLYFNDEDLESLKIFEDKPERNAKILSKLKKAITE